MKTVKEIKNTMALYKITQDELADAMGVMQQTANAWFVRDSIPNKHYESLMSNLNTLVKSRDLIYKEKTKEEDKGLMIIKLYDMQVSAGSGFIIDSLTEMSYTNMTIDRSIIPTQYLSSDIVAMRVDGRSMVPTLLPGEIVLYKEDFGRYYGDALYIVNFGGMLMVKKIQFNPELNKYDIISDNPEFKSYSVNLEDDQTSLIIIGKVIATIQQ